MSPDDLSDLFDSFEARQAAKAAEAEKAMRQSQTSTAQAKQFVADSIMPELQQAVSSISARGYLASVETSSASHPSALMMFSAHVEGSRKIRPAWGLRFELDGDKISVYHEPPTGDREIAIGSPDSEPRRQWLWTRDIRPGWVAAHVRRFVERVLKEA